MSHQRRLRIAITVDPEIPVPPRYYGGIERIVDMLARELQDRGHEVHLFANRQSTVPVTIAPYPRNNSLSQFDTLRNMFFLQQYISRQGPFDIIHSFARLAYLLPLMPLSIPKIQSYQRMITPRSIRLGTLIAPNSLSFTSCSDSNSKPVRHLGGNWTTIYNGVEVSKYKFVPHISDNAPLVFLGRVERFKGAHTAIKVAQSTGRSLVIAGNHATNGDEADYFQQEIQPHCDGEQIKYIGPVDDMQKNTLLGQAAALLFPIEAEEAFGIVMIEALACGTPVIAFQRSSVPEVVDHGNTGFVCSSIDEMIAAVQHLDQLDRSNCRNAVDKRFSEKVITDQYESLYYSSILSK